MTFLITCRASEDITAARHRTRRAHLRYILAHRQYIAFGGALLGPGEQMTGMVIALEVAERAQAEDFIRQEPYCAAGLFPQISIDWMVTRIPEPAKGFLHRELEQESTRADPTTPADQPAAGAP